MRDLCWRGETNKLTDYLEEQDFQSLKAFWDEWYPVLLYAENDLEKK